MSEAQIGDAVREMTQKINEQVAKRQYWNAIFAANHMTLHLIRLFDKVLKENGAAPASSCFCGAEREAEIPINGNHGICHSQDRCYVLADERKRRG